MSALVHPEDRPIPEGGSLSAPLADAVAPLTRLWSETRSDEVARRLVALSEAFAAFFRRLPKKGGLFERLVAKGEPPMLTLLLRSVTNGTERAATDRLTKVWERYGTDPRTKVYLNRWIERGEPPYPRGRSFTTTLARVQHEWATASSRDETLFRVLTDADRALLDRADALLASVPKRRGALALLRDVYRHPRDMSRRVVLADALMDLGDPWGEFIAIQCAQELGAADTAQAAHREQELLNANRRTWLGRLSPWVLDTPLAAFDHGFPSDVTVPIEARAQGLYEWSTLTTIEVAPRFAPGLSTLALVNRLRSVTSARLVALPRDGAMPRLCGRNEALERLTLSIGLSTPDVLARFLDEWSRFTGFPNLKRLDIEAAAETDIDVALAFLDAPFGSKLTEIGVRSQLIALITRITPILAAGRALPLLRSSSSRASVRFEPKARSLTVSLGAAVHMRELATELEGARLRELRVEASPEAWRSAATDPWRAPLSNVAVDVVRVGG